MNWIQLSQSDSAASFENYCKTGEFSCAAAYNQIREDMVLMFNNVLTMLNINEEQISSKNYSYQVDLNFGLGVYELLNTRYGMNVRAASTPGVWRYLSVCVVPDLITKRYGNDHPDRFWKKSKRLWLRVLWWYIHLSWQGTAEKTLEVLKDNSTDEILQLVDRCGRNGYRVDLCREIMRVNSSFSLEERRKKQIFRKIMVLNTARVQVVEPALFMDQEPGYVKYLYGYFEKEVR